MKSFPEDWAAWRNVESSLSETATAWPSTGQEFQLNTPSWKYDQPGILCDHAIWLDAPKLRS